MVLLLCRIGKLVWCLLLHSSDRNIPGLAPWLLRITGINMT